MLVGEKFPGLQGFRESLIGAADKLPLGKSSQTLIVAGAGLGFYEARKVV